MKTLLALFLMFAVTNTAVASDSIRTVEFLKDLVSAPVYAEYMGHELGTEKPCKLMIDYTDAKESGQFKVEASAEAILWVNRNGSNWPVKFQVAVKSSTLELQYAEIESNHIEAQTLVIPNDQYSSKERQTLTLAYNDVAIQASIVNEVKGWFGYKTKYKASCLLERK